MVIRFYDFNFNLVHIEPEFLSSSWTVYFNKEGTFEAHFSINSEVLSVVTANKYLVAKQGEFSAIITGYNAEDEFTVYGRTCNWLLKKRVTLPNEQTSVYSGTLACTMASSAFSDVSNFVTENKSYGKVISFSSERPETAYDAITRCLKEGSIGHEIRFDTENKRWVFATLKSVSTNLMISESLKNASDTSIVADILDLADSGYYKKTTEDTEGNEVIEYVLLQNGSKSGIYRWETVLSESNETEAKTTLNTKKENSTIKLSTHGIFYGSDYSLGDIVRVQIVKGVLKKTVKKRICGVEVKHTSSARYEQPIFEEV